MSHERALLFAVATFVVSMAVVVGLFAVLDVRMVFVAGPLVVAGISGVVVYRTAVRRT